MSGDVQVRFCERLGVKFPRATHPNIYVRSEGAGHRVMASVVRFIDRRLRLKVNQAKSAVARPEERHFVGFSLRRNLEDGSVEVFLSKRSKTRIEARVRELTPRAWGQSLKGCVATLNTYLRGCSCRTVNSPRFRAVLFRYFAGLVLCLAIAGVDGVMAWERRSRAGAHGRRIVSVPFT